MKLVCGPLAFAQTADADSMPVVLYDPPHGGRFGSAGHAARDEIARKRLNPSTHAWDLLSIALSVVTADFAAQRAQSPDGWTREIQLDIAVSAPDFWRTQQQELSAALAFLTTDRWSFRFHGGGDRPPIVNQLIQPEEDCVVLLSGGLDSLIGTIDLVAGGRRPYAISQVVRGDAEKQMQFAGHIGGGISHMQLNHNAAFDGDAETSQRARSFIFLAFGVVAATSLQRYHNGENVPLFICENGFIAINPPLTGTRLGSLSTRTAHPEFLGRLQNILNAAGLRIQITNPYILKTKGEMLEECMDQAYLANVAAQSTSCGRFQRFGYRHCGRCIPCQVRRAAFLKWGAAQDTTGYVYDALGLDNDEHARFDDVRSVAMALSNVQQDGVTSWLGSALSSPRIADRAGLQAMLTRGLNELSILHQQYGVR
ncbi:MAG TPA: hypothetical protein DHV59_11595 [Oxalobacteraceae bacterium]|nr:hypothetical protein [Oxalobacteraceae bacterium]